MDEFDIIIGRNPVREALKAGREIDTLYILESSEGSIREIASIAQKKGIPIKKVPKSKLDELSRPYAHEGSANHQGVAARVAAVTYSTLDDIFSLAEKKGEPPFIIALDGIEDPYNVGAILRSAEVFGAHGLILQKRRSAGLTWSAAKTASGAEEYIPVARVTNLSSAIEEVKKRGVFVAAADMEGTSADRVNLQGAIMLVIGSEGKGVSRLVKEKADFIVKIDMYGRISSLNASAAAAVLMYEKVRQSR